MDFRETLRIAVRSIRAHNLRSALTMLGVVVGIGSVIVFATFGASVQAAVVSQIGQTSANSIFLTPASIEGGGQNGPPGAGIADATRPVFTERDVTELGDIDGVNTVVPQGTIRLSGVSYAGDTVAQRQAIGTTPAAFGNDDIVDGRAFESGAREVVVNEAARTAFEQNLSVGDTITLTFADGDRQNATVVGVADGTRGGLLSQFGPSGPQLYLPSDPFYQTSVEGTTDGVRVIAYPQVTVIAEPSQTGTVADAVRAYASESDAAALLPAGQTIGVQTTGEIVGQIQDILGQLTRFVTGIAVLSLVVGAIGIANITLVSVTERTREIGIMKAVGAQNRDVMQLFLTESALLGTGGAMLGIPIGLVVAWGATRFAEVGFTLALDWMVFAVVVGVAVGVGAGLYPAWRAARVDPIEALRQE
ncbi:ABC transporter permease [Halobaculum sp. MBLA0147]|uniref:ABC transporter permease n=1 Tax=Halobaculum sp. MBLA0147 TaxID=3079934 RepID=UPI003523D9D4